MKQLYRGEWSTYGNPRAAPRFVKTGECRAPRAGEYYLSGAIPTAYRAPNDLSTAYPIMRMATSEETHCKCCGQRLPEET